MMTLKQFHGGLTSVPASVTWHLADLGEARGKQDLFLKQSPQNLKALREHAIIESAKGEKTALVLGAIEASTAPFTVNDLERTCPRVSRETIQLLLHNLRRDGKVECLGRGPGARWQKKGYYP